MVVALAVVGIAVAWWVVCARVPWLGVLGSSAAIIAIASSWLRVRSAPPPPDPLFPALDAAAVVAVHLVPLLWAGAALTIAIASAISRSDRTERRAVCGSRE